MSTVYALSRVKLQIVDRRERLVKVVDTNTNDYYLNQGGWRQVAISIDNWIYNISPETHGFKTFYYGIGKLKK